MLLDLSLSSSPMRQSPSPRLQQFVDAEASYAPCASSVAMIVSVTVTVTANDPSACPCCLLPYYKTSACFWSYFWVLLESAKDSVDVLVFF